MTALTARDTRDAVAAPAAPILRPQISRAFPAMLITFITVDVHMEVLEFPMALSRPTPLLYRARKR